MQARAISIKSVGVSRSYPALFSWAPGSSVATALTVHIKDESSETAKFIDYMDKFFDLMNVRNYSDCYMQLKQFKAPYRLAKGLILEV